jgi:three-Cys-motif partner protein
VNSEFAALQDRCMIEQAEANSWLRTWCASEVWSKHRAVVFLDPYGMSVEWSTLEAIARTKAIDLWVLFPLGIGPTRVLPANALPEGRWAKRLTKLFGTEDWMRFYRREPKPDLFNAQEEAWNRDASVQSILRFFLERMAGIFARVVDQPLILTNSKNSPMYALCFAAGNPGGAKTAVKIAAYITRN